MRFFLLLLFFVVVSFFSGQEFHLTQSLRGKSNGDKRLYRIVEDSSSVFLGSIEIYGALENEVEAFQKFYQKAKSIGANAYSLEAKDIFGRQSSQSLKKVLRLYFVQGFTEEYNVFYVFNSGKTRKIVIDGKRVELPEDGYLRARISQKNESYISTGKFLGSSVHLYYKEGQPAQYFQVLSAGMEADHKGGGGLFLKRGILCC
ncbi:MAG: hypothetical protein FDW93_04005 [Bergeyella sp.]|nr:hypothetical protein [Bergeyella sp.]